MPYHYSRGYYFFDARRFGVRHEKHYRRPDGFRVKIVASLYAKASEPDVFVYSHYVMTCKKASRDWRPVFDDMADEYRQLSDDAKRYYISSRELLVLSRSEIQQAKLELWEMLKPQ